MLLEIALEVVEAEVVTAAAVSVVLAAELVGVAVAALMTVDEHEDGEEFGVVLTR